MGSMTDWRPHKTVSELEHSSTEIIQFEEQRKDKDYKRIEQSLRHLWNNFNWFNIHVNESQE